MDKDKVFKYFFVFFLIITLYLAYLILRPYFTYIILGVIFTFAFNPLYAKLQKKVKNKNLAASIMVFGVILVIMIPSFFILVTLTKQTAAAVAAVTQSHMIDTMQTFLQEKINLTVDLAKVMDTATTKLKDSLISFSISMIGKVSDMVLGVFVTFCVMFYGLKSGDELFQEIKTLIPLHDRYKNKFFDEIKNLTNAVIYGQLITSIAQGFIGGMGFWLFGIPNPLFWGVIMVIFGFLPFVGTPMIWVPAVLYKLLQHEYTMAICLLIYSAILTTNVDNAMRPFLISSKTRLHPLLVILGVFGGLMVFGFIGIIIGPVILAILVIFLQEYTIDFKSTLVQKDEPKDDIILEDAAEKELEKEEKKEEERKEERRERREERKKEKQEEKDEENKADKKYNDGKEDE